MTKALLPVHDDSGQACAFAGHPAGADVGSQFTFETDLVAAPKQLLRNNPRLQLGIFPGPRLSICPNDSILPGAYAMNVQVIVPRSTGSHRGTAS